MRAAKSACLNCAEGAGRVSRADKARVFGIARAEAGEAAAAVEIAVAAGDADEGALAAVLVNADRFIAMMTALISGEVSEIPCNGPMRLASGGRSCHGKDADEERQEDPP
jgi:hypothetical protein